MSSTDLRIVIISGLSGSGKTTAAKALEDAEYFCIDNLPVVLLDKFLVLCRDHPEVRKVGLVIDIRSRAFLDSFDEAYRRTLQEGFAPKILFLTCDDPVLVQRYSETRRVHPLASSGRDLADAVRQERQLLNPVEHRAHTVLDTTDQTVHELKRTIHRLVQGDGETLPMHARVQSFGFKHGVPNDADYVFDVRFLPNPFFVLTLRPKSGLDPEIVRYLESQPMTERYLERLQALFELVIPEHRGEGKMRLNVAIGCTGGRHRSVYVATRVARMLETLDAPVRLLHRDLDRESGP